MKKDSGKVYKQVKLTVRRVQTKDGSILEEESQEDVLVQQDLKGGFAPRTAKLSEEQADILNEQSVNTLEKWVEFEPTKRVRKTKEEEIKTES